MLYHLCLGVEDATNTCRFMEECVDFQDLLASMIEKGGGYLLSYYAVPFAIEHFKISVGTLVMLEFVKPYSTL